MRQFLCVHARMLRSSELRPAGACAESLWRGRERESARTAADVDRYPSRHMTWRHGVRDSPTNRPSADHALVCFQIVSTKMFLNFFLQIWFEAIRKNCPHEIAEFRAFFLTRSFYSFDVSYVHCSFKNITLATIKCGHHQNIPFFKIIFCSCAYYMYHIYNYPWL